MQTFRCAWSTKTSIEWNVLVTFSRTNLIYEATESRLTSHRPTTQAPKIHERRYIYWFPSNTVSVVLYFWKVSWYCMFKKQNVRFIWWSLFTEILMRSKFTKQVYFIRAQIYFQSTLNLSSAPYIYYKQWTVNWSSNSYSQKSTVPQKSFSTLLWNKYFVFSLYLCSVYISKLICSLQFSSLDLCLSFQQCYLSHLYQLFHSSFL